MKLGMAQGELESHSNPNNLVDRSPRMVKKECVVRVNSRVMFLQCTCHSFEFLHLTVFVETRCFARLVFCDPRRDDVAFVFCFFVFFFLTAKVVLIKVSLYVKGCLERGAFN